MRFFCLSFVPCLIGENLASAAGKGEEPCFVLTVVHYEYDSFIQQTDTPFVVVVVVVVAKTLLVGFQHFSSFPR